ncbi:hypothetical protein JJV70_14520 [Streptomyces sp. JJ66]|uniref:hypothetical protein n=1 Tax=Streptomyces sp. JJ66 TaxID=2803843 RepID=UPI001C5A1B92|nr:hypothetical protein [Streptomyces sp. JJ66]MBW1603292.1 hypothetical protein [Streptomyces sp. JJ66]
MTTRIGQVIMLLHGGDREEARNRFAALWPELEAGGHLLQQVTVAHYMADVQDDPGAELAWDLRALGAADALTEDEVAFGEHAVAVRGLYPSLYLNLAADYLKLADRAAARRELDRCHAVLDALADDAYGATVRAAVGRLEARLSGESP